VNSGVRVAVDGTPLLGVRTGIGHVVAGTIDALSRRPELKLSVYAITLRGRHNLARCVPSNTRAATAPIPARAARAAWRRSDTPKIERWTGPVDVVHATNYVPPPARSPVLVSVYDLGFVRYPTLATPDAHDYAALIRRGLARGAVVHVTSDFVASEVRDEFGLPVDRVVRVYPGIDALVPGDTEQGRALAGSSRYVLALGTVEPRKGLPVLVDAFDAIASRDRDLHLVVAGQAGWGVDEFDDACNRAVNRVRIRRLPYVSPGDRAALLTGATVFAYPSKYEGFGISPLEAMTVGTPVVATTAGAIPEVVGNAAVLVPVDDRDALATALERVLSDDSLRADLVARGTERVRRYPWDATARELAAIYEGMR
jgi:glycosyltransferase involved in cell wall biosynthesis